jgi:DNA-binding XRE family transcriptional regulator
LRYEQIADGGIPPVENQKPKRLVLSQGSRNSTLTSFAGYFRYKGFAEDQIRPVLDELNRAVCEPPLRTNEVTHICRSIGKYPTDHEDAFGDLADVVEQELKWLTHPYFVRGAVNVIEGNPGDGKSTFVVALAAAVSSRVGLNLRRLREAKGLTQEELAHQADVHQTYLSGVEGGKRNPSIVVLNRIATALGSDISLLFDSSGARAKRPTR